MLARPSNSAPRPRAGVCGIEQVIVDQAALAGADLMIDFGGGRPTGTARDWSSRWARSMRCTRARSRFREWDTGGEATHAEQLHALFLEWLDEASCLVVNPPRAMGSNGSKPLQIQTDPHAVRENLTEIEGEIARREPDPQRADYDWLLLRISRTARVEGKPDLVRAGEGDEVPVAASCSSGRARDAAAPPSRPHLLGRHHGRAAS